MGPGHLGENGYSSLYSLGVVRVRLVGYTDSQKSLDPGDNQEHSESNAASDQYFSLPHRVHLDSSGLQWTPLDSTGLHLDCVSWGGFETGGLIFRWTPVDSTGLDHINS